MAMARVMPLQQACYRSDTDAGVDLDKGPVFPYVRCQS